MIRAAAYILSASAVVGPAFADLRAAPDYFLGALISTDVAQAIAVNCPSLRVDPTVAQEMAENVSAWLSEDGFDATDPASEMIEFSDQLFALKQRFMGKHDLLDANAAQICAAGIKEMKAKTDVGNLLVEVAQ